VALATTLAPAASRPAWAGGVTTHVVAGQQVQQLVKDPELKQLLTTWEGAFLHGTLYPDAVLQALKLGDPEGLKEKSMPPGYDELSHGIEQEPGDKPRGITARFWADYWKTCPNGPVTDDCSRNLAFYLGILTHLVTDGPWHNELLDTTTVNMCEAEVANMDRHQVLDRDFDACLSGALLGEAKDAPMLQNPVIYTKATFLRKSTVMQTSKAVYKRRLALTCSGDDFLDLSTGKCFSCPPGYSHDIFKKATESGVCYVKAETTASRKRGTLAWDCPSGEFPDATGTACYSCPKNYSHNGLVAVDTSGVCYAQINQTANLKNALATCASGEFPNAALDSCYSCPQGYTHNPAVDADRDGACFQVSPDKLGCSTGFFDPRNGGECWSCPANYSRHVVAGVDTATACARPGMLQCSSVSAPKGSRKSMGAFPTNSSLYKALAAANKEGAFKPPGAYYAAAMSAFDGLFAVQGITAAAVAAGPAAAVCPKMIAAGVNGKGGLMDSAIESAQFLDELWKRRADKGKISVIRIDTYEYAIVKDNNVVHANDMRSCDTTTTCTSDESSCVADAAGTAGLCHRLFTPRVMVAEGSWGSWRAEAVCPTGMFAQGFRQRVEAPQQGNADDSALNAVRLICAQPGTARTREISSHDGLWGAWSNPTSCPTGQYITGAKMRIEAPQPGTGDDTAANDVKMVCSGGQEIAVNNGGPWGDWTSPVSCPSGTAVCGLQTRFEDSQNERDDTGMNGLKLVCCAK